MRSGLEIYTLICTGSIFDIYMFNKLQVWYPRNLNHFYSIFNINHYFAEFSSSPGSLDGVMVRMMPVKTCWTRLRGIPGPTKARMWLGPGPSNSPRNQGNIHGGFFFPYLGNCTRIVWCVWYLDRIPSTTRSSDWNMIHPRYLIHLSAS